MASHPPAALANRDLYERRGRALNEPWRADGAPHQVGQADVTRRLAISEIRARARARHQAAAVNGYVDPVELKEVLDDTALGQRGDPRNLWAQRGAVMLSEMGSPMQTRADAFDGDTSNANFSMERSAPRTARARHRLDRGGPFADDVPNFEDPGGRYLYRRLRNKNVEELLAADPMLAFDRSKPDHDKKVLQYSTQRMQDTFWFLDNPDCLETLRGMADTTLPPVGLSQRLQWPHGP
mmetsp:Transcript_67281/g.179421  ORF Transcript_67281/g.179421 Transcript_67281/m.179421 type:complete len:238 (+) Transcript_67281:19-732(+)